MANTLNLGNGNWATKEDSLLAYNSENGNFKPLPFDFTRASSATVVNKAGLIETVGSGEPRIDFSNDAKGALLLEPSRSNRVTYSEDLTQWTDYNASAVLSNETIYGKNAYKIVEDSTVNYHGIYLTNLFTADGTNYIWSVYVKGAERRYVVLTGRTGISSNASALIFDTQDGVWVLDSSSQNEALSAESVGNGWWRISMEGDPTSGVYDSYTIASSLGGSTYTDANYQGDGTSGVYIYGAQLEQGSYATSYIPTQGSAVTRVGESTINNLSNQVSLTEGVFYIDVTNLGRLQNANILTQNSTVNSVYGYIQTNNRIVFGLFANSVSIPITSSLEYTIGTRTKIAFHYKSGNSKLYVNGFLAGNSTDTFTIGSGFADAIRLIDNSSAYFAFPEKSTVKEFKIYNTALTDAELIALTKI